MVAYLEVAKPHIEKCYMTPAGVIHRRWRRRRQRRLRRRRFIVGSGLAEASTPKEKKGTAGERVYKESVAGLGVAPRREKIFQVVYSGVICLKQAHQKVRKQQQDIECTRTAAYIGGSAPAIPKLPKAPHCVTCTAADLACPENSKAPGPEVPRPPQPQHLIFPAGRNPQHLQSPGFLKPHTE